MQNYENILREVFPSKEMADYLAGRTLYTEYFAEAVASAPISLNRKLEMFTALADHDDFFKDGTDWLRRIIGEMELKQGEFLYLKGYDNEEPKWCIEDYLLPFLKWEYLFEYIEENLKDRYDSVHFRVEKWVPEGNGRLVNPCDFIIINGEVCHGDYNGHSKNRPEEPFCFHLSELRDINLPVPFHAGDIVTIDCRPYAPISHVVILEIGDNLDCCCVQAMYREDDGTYDIGALKHGNVFPFNTRCYSKGFSPLYRLASYKSQLSEDERILEEVSRYVDSSEERGRELWGYIASRGSYEKETKTESQILEFIERKLNTDNGN